MLHIRLTFLFLLAFAIAIFSQEAVKNIHFGLSVAPELNVSNFKSLPELNNKPSYGMAMSGDISFDLAKRLQFKSGISFHAVTLKHRDYSPAYPADVINGMAVLTKSFDDYNTDYTFVGVPFQLRVITSEKRVHAYFTGGGEMTYNLYSSGTIETTESGSPGHFHKPQDYPFRINRTQLFLNAGSGLEWNGSKSKISLGPVVEYSMMKNFELNSSSLKNGHLLFLGIGFSYH
ncbi:MAG: hypothetical protein ABJC12_04660 [Saprospiraceae bacterium]